MPPIQQSRLSRLVGAIKRLSYLAIVSAGTLLTSAPANANPHLNASASMRTPMAQKMGQPMGMFGDVITGTVVGTLPDKPGGIGTEFAVTSDKVVVDAKTRQPLDMTGKITQVSFINDALLKQRGLDDKAIANVHTTSGYQFLKTDAQGKYLGHVAIPADAIAVHKVAAATSPTAVAPQRAATQSVTSAPTTMTFRQSLATIVSKSGTSKDVDTRTERFGRRFDTSLRANGDIMVENPDKETAPTIISRHPSTGRIGVTGNVNGVAYKGIVNQATQKLDLKCGHGGHVPHKIIVKIVLDATQSLRVVGAVLNGGFPGNVFIDNISSVGISINGVPLQQALAQADTATSAKVLPSAAASVPAAPASQVPPTPQKAQGASGRAHVPPAVVMKSPAHAVASKSTPDNCCPAEIAALKANTDSLNALRQQSVLQTAALDRETAAFATQTATLVAEKKSVDNMLTLLASHIPPSKPVTPKGTPGAYVQPVDPTPAPKLRGANLDMPAGVLLGPIVLAGFVQNVVPAIPPAPMPAAPFEVQAALRARTSDDFLKGRKVQRVPVEPLARGAHNNVKPVVQTSWSMSGSGVTASQAFIEGREIKTPPASASTAVDLIAAWRDARKAVTASNKVRDNVVAMNALVVRGDLSRALTKMEQALPAMAATDANAAFKAGRYMINKSLDDNTAFTLSDKSAVIALLRANVANMKDAKLAEQATKYLNRIEKPKRVVRTAGPKPSTLAA